MCGLACGNMSHVTVWLDQYHLHGEMVGGVPVDVGLGLQLWQHSPSSAGTLSSVLGCMMGNIM